MRIRYVILAGMLVLGGLAAPARAAGEDDLVPNSQYARWASFKPGTTVVTKIVTELTFTPAGGLTGAKREYTCTQKLHSVAEDKVVLDVSYEGPGAGTGLLVPQLVEIPAKIEKSRAEYPMAVSKDVRITGLRNGNGRIDIEGKPTDVKTKEMDVESTSNGQTARTRVRLWLLDSVPGGIVRQISDTAIVMGDKTSHNTRTSTLVSVK